MTAAARSGKSRRPPGAKGGAKPAKAKARRAAKPPAVHDRDAEPDGISALGLGEPAGPASARSSPAMAEIDADVLEFIAAIDRFKKKHNRPFPNWSEVLHVLRGLGYARR